MQKETIAVNIRLDKDLHDKLEKVCEKEHRSKSNMIDVIIREYLKNYI